MTVTYRTGYSTTRRTIEELKAWSRFSNIHPEMQRRTIALMDAARAAGVDLGIGGGFRTEAEQFSLFDSRHDVVASGGCCSYDGKRWALVTGAHAAPPNRSYHEATIPYAGRAYGAAFDMVGWESGWMEENIARFGMKTFTDVNGENWHIQMVEVPNSRSSYDPNIHLITTWSLPVAAPAPSPVIVVPKPTIRSGSIGDQVRLLQSQMKFWGWYPFAVDGSAGPRTVEAIKKLQATVKVGTDGVYGPVTADAWRRWQTVVASLA